MFSQNDIDTYQFIRATDLKQRETPRGTIYLDTSSGKVHVVQRWHYRFTVEPGRGLSPWTDDEMAAFHYALCSAVGAAWNSQTPMSPSTDPAVQQFLSLVRKASNVRIGVSGRGDFAQRFSAKGLDIDFDIILTSARPHWHVTLLKVPPTSTRRAEVDWGAGSIHLHTIDNDRLRACQIGANRKCAQPFVISAHEFGHTIKAPDEYYPGDRRRSDLTSIMNIGTEVRQRHYAFIVGQLNHMAPGCVFRAM